jgi:nucleoside-diphosphate-sugar epimerase
MQRKRILVVGYGKLGSRVAENLSQQHEVIAIKRSPIAPTNTVQLCFADLSDPESLNHTLHTNIKVGVDYLIYCLSPNERSEQGYRDAYLFGLKNVLASLPKVESLKHIIFISSTSVYHQENGEQVDEQSPCLPSSFSGKVLLEAESYLASLHVTSTVIRFSGIYGGGRSRLIDQVKDALSKGNVLTASVGYTNRIHEDDCVGFICHLITLLVQNQTLEACYVATDSCPIEQAKVYQFIADQLCTAGNNYKAPFNIKETGSAKSSRRAGSKQCLNKRMKQSAYELKFESYKEGYLDALKEDC